MAARRPPINWRRTRDRDRDGTAIISWSRHTGLSALGQDLAPYTRPSRPSGPPLHQSCRWPRRRIRHARAPPPMSEALRGARGGPTGNPGAASGQERVVRGDDVNTPLACRRGVRIGDRHRRATGQHVADGCHDLAIAVVTKSRPSSKARPPPRRHLLGSGDVSAPQKTPEAASRGRPGYRIDREHHARCDDGRSPSRRESLAVGDSGDRPFPGTFHGPVCMALSRLPPYWGHSGLRRAGGSSTGMGAYAGSLAKPRTEFQNAIASPSRGGGGASRTVAFAGAVKARHGKTVHAWSVSPRRQRQQFTCPEHGRRRRIASPANASNSPPLLRRRRRCRAP